MVFPHQRDVVSITQDDHPSLATHLETELLKERDDHILALTAAKDWADYEKRRGMINGLNAAISICREVNKKLNA